ncbi:MAG: ATP synthase subunit I [Solobacterium sp.]|jgi:hypothetical protein|nr:ATP synthase subunit I [Solobacterium sp.]
MTERSWKIYRILLVIGLCSGLIKRTYGLGFGLGAAASLLIYKKIELMCDTLIQRQEAGRIQVYSGFLVDYAIMAAVLILAAKLPDWFNIFAAALGLGLIKITAVAELLFSGKGDANEH